MNLGTLIDIIRMFQHDEEEYLRGLETLLNHYKIETVIDVCGGTGFPVIDLAKKGWDVTYSDGSREMIDIFRQNMKSVDIQIPYFHSDWLNLTKNIERKFDLVLCRSNSLLYIDSWGENKIDEKTPLRIEKALEEFFLLLNDHGRLYVDIYDKNLERTQIAEVKHEMKNLSGVDVGLSYRVIHEPENKIRTWATEVMVGGQRYSHQLNSYLLSHTELIQLLKSVGFVNIREEAVCGESLYTVYIAEKS